jgi:hypothetical protein
MLRLNEEWEDRVCEEYCIYLEQLDPDVSPMGYEAFEWAKVREAQEEYAESFIFME